MSESKKVSISFNMGWLTILLMVFAVLISTGTWVPKSEFFLWSWLNFNIHPVATILSILFIPAAISILLWLLCMLAMVIVLWIAYR